MMKRKAQTEASFLLLHGMNHYNYTYNIHTVFFVINILETLHFIHPINGIFKTKSGLYMVETDYLLT